MALTCRASSVGTRESRSTPSRPAASLALAKRRDAREAADRLTPLYAGTAPPIVVRCIKRRWGIS